MIVEFFLGADTQLSKSTDYVFDALAFGNSKLDLVAEAHTAVYQKLANVEQTVFTGFNGIFAGLELAVQPLITGKQAESVVVGDQAVFFERIGDGSSTARKKDSYK